MRYRRYSRRRRSRSVWAFSTAQALLLNSAGQYSYFWILPPGRVNYLCDTDRVDSLVFNGAHLWLDFHWVQVSTNSLPDVTMFAIVTEAELGGEPADIGEFGPFDQPSTPSSITEWNDAPNIDGTDSFLWSHHIKGSSPPNAVVWTQNYQGSAGNQYINTNSDADHAALVCRKFSVAAEWQPDVIIKSRRRLKKDEGIAFIMQSDTAITSNDVVHLEAHCRTLVNRGR